VEEEGLGNGTISDRRGCKSPYQSRYQSGISSYLNRICLETKFNKAIQPKMFSPTFPEIPSFKGLLWLISKNKQTKNQTKTKPHP